MAQYALQEQFKKRTVGKKYLALVHGQIQPATALIDAPIGRDPRQRKKMSVITPGSPRAASSRARSAQTQYRSLTFYDDYSLLECSLYTGRTHQIRVHLAYIDYPIVGDTVYGRRKQPLPLKRHFLHAAELTIKRPSDQKELTFTAELPPELKAVLDNLKV
jgi:23S rRNA pseudouridine1911/1915/1917 synthase